MSERSVWVFFYGSFINLDVLADVGIAPDTVHTARLDGFDIRIEPLANLVASEEHSVYGILVKATHRELGDLYGQDWVGVYQPEAVVVETSAGGLVPALCYISPRTDTAAPRRDYVERILGPAREYGFPVAYIERLEGWIDRADPE